MGIQRKLFTNSIICFIILGTVFPLSAQNISITSIKTAKDRTVSGEFNETAEIIANNSIKIRGIRFSKSGEKLRFKLPEYISSKGRVYPQVRLLNKEAEQVLIEALETGEPGSVYVSKHSFRLGQFRLLDTPSSLKALARVVFDDALEIECKIFEGENGLWVSWPSQQNPKSGRWKKLVDITDYKLRESVERALLDKYRALRSMDK